MVVLPLLFAFVFTQNDYDLKKMNVESSGPQPPYRCKIVTTSKKKCTLLAIWLRPLTWLLPKKMVARPPMVALLAIWLHSLTWLPPKKRLRDPLWLRSWQYCCIRYLSTTKKMVARPPMVALLAIWLRPLTWLPPKKRLLDLLWSGSWQYGCAR